MDPRPAIQRKILSRDELVRLRADARREGRSVVQCHGCFDIVHPGHIRHLQQAARLADILLVSITADAAMKKGDGRPLFPQELRAENLAALDFVDWVHIDHDETALQLLEAVQPDIYIKGREYETNNDPRFAAERAAVEKRGGRVVFSSGDIVFSSTALIAAMERREDPFQARLQQLADSGEIDAAHLTNTIDNFAGKRICVIGETIIDTYILCDRPDIASEGPMMSLRPVDRLSFDGGAAVIARHMAAMGARPTLLTAMPRTTQAQALRDRLEDEGVEVRHIETTGPMLEKQRYLVGTQKVMKLDLVQPLVVDPTRQNELLALARAVCTKCDGLVLADFGQGLLTPRLIAEIVAGVRDMVGTITGDVSGPRNGLMKMKHLDLICPTEQELRAATNNYEDSLNAVAWRAMQATNVRHAFVTLGADGLIAFERTPEADSADTWVQRVRAEHLPAFAPHPVDTLGCGDALLAAATLALTTGARPLDAAFLGSVAAALEANRLGNDVIGSVELRLNAARILQSRLAITASRVGARMAM